VKGKPTLKTEKEGASRRDAGIPRMPARKGNVGGLVSDAVRERRIRKQPYGGTWERGIQIYSAIPGLNAPLTAGKKPLGPKR